VQVVLLRVGIDTGSGGTPGPIFEDGSFEFIPIPDYFGGPGVNATTYGKARAPHGGSLADYLPTPFRERLSCQSIHSDPEFRARTYGDPTPPKASLRKLRKGDLLVFYAGLKGWGFNRRSALYIIGYFEVTHAGRVKDFTRAELARFFGSNFHVKHKRVLAHQKDKLVLVKGGGNSRLLRKAVQISALGRDVRGRPLFRLSKGMQRIFSDFDGHTSIQRSPPRWVPPGYVTRAAEFVRTLE
jgi:Nucleotide modification associated domain 3